MSRLLETALDCLEEGVLITDAQLDAPGPHIVYANRGFEQMTGYRAQEVVGRSPRLLQGPRTERAVLDRLKRDVQQDGCWRGETYNYRKDGSEFRMQLSICPVRAADGQTTHYVAIQRNAEAPSRINAEFYRHVAAQHAPAEAAKRLNDQLSDIARLNTLGDMAGRLAHELNQPLTAISNYAQGCANRLQGNQIDSPELTSVLELIRDAALRAGEIVDRLRNFVRRKGPHQVEIDLESLIRRLLDLIEPEIRQSRVRVELEFDADFPPVLADESQIEQVIVGLVRNSLEAMTDTPLEERRLTIRGAPSAGNEIEVAVCDRGRGLRGEAAERLFEPFFSTKPFGLGMGLPISRSILQWHGGRIWVEPNADRGACFRFTLPIRHGETSNGDSE
ncbi:MAG: ATP-binding protein [Pirellulales bacterium]